MRAEELFAEIERKQKEQERNLEETKNLIKQLKACKDDDFEWVCVKKASEKMGCSVNLIYDKVKAKKLDVKRFNGKLLVSMKQIQEINDKA